MPPTSHDPKQLVIQLEAAKNRFDSGHVALVTKLLIQLAQCQFTDPHQLIRFHECLLFLRAFPRTASLVSRVENLLRTFHLRVAKLLALHADMSPFDEFDTSGIAGTTMQDILSFDVVRWLVRRIPRNVDIAWNDYWEDYQSERARGSTWPRFIPLLEEDADVEANIPWKSWLDAARGRENPLPWLIRRVKRIPLPDRQRAELYDSLRFPIRWKLENLKFSRTRNWTRPRRFFFHNVQLIQRSEVSLSHELSEPAPELEKLSTAAGESVIRSLREFMAVRYRDLYGATLGDAGTVVRARIGRGVVIHVWGLPPTRRLPLRAYLCGYTLKNGVPINYFEAIGLCEWLEVGFNTFYTYRQGETAWNYAQALRCLCALTAAKCISIYPYQIGQDNDEAIESGAFWFYRKLGFRPGRADLQRLCEREERKIAANPQYRTPPGTLKRLAEAHMFYDVESAEGHIDGTGKGSNRAKRFVSGHAFRRAESLTNLEPASAAAEPAPWDTFSVRTLGLLVNRRMSREFGGDSRKIRQASTARVIRALGISAFRWSSGQYQALENWSLVLALIPTLSRWTPEEKRQLIKIIRAKSAPNEMIYVHQSQHHPRLRAELLRLGS
jgi:hypothetical protein